MDIYMIDQLLLRFDIDTTDECIYMGTTTSSGSQSTNAGKSTLSSQVNGYNH